MQALQKLTPGGKPVKAVRALNFIHTVDSRRGQAVKRRTVKGVIQCTGSGSSRNIWVSIQA